jgi:hypothetical protein
VSERERNNGWITTETIVAIGILSVLFFAFVKTIQATGELNRLHLARQRCLAAAQAQLNCIKATGRQLIAEDVERLWPGLEVSVEQLSGRGDWKGLRLIKVTTTDKSVPRKVEVRLCRYIAIEKVP